MRSFVARRPVLAAFLLAATVLALTADERTFGLLTDGQVMTRTAYSIAKLGELGTARGHPVNRVRPEGDAVTRYGLGPSLARVPAAWLAGPFERSFGVGSSQTLFVAGQLLWILLASLSAAGLVRAWGGSPAEAGLSLLAVALASPLWGYTSSDFSEPLQAAAVGGSVALAALSAARVERDRTGDLLAAAAGAAAGIALLSKSIFIILLPVVGAGIVLGSAAPLRLRRGLLALLGWLPGAGLWLAFEVVRFGRPFASYEGESFSHPVLDGLWRLTVGPNKGLFLYFPLALLSLVGLARLLRARPAAAGPAAGFAAFLLLTTAAWWSWDGVSGWGPRLLIPLVPLLGAAAVLGARGLPRALFRTLFGLGSAVGLLGALQPDGATTSFYFSLPPRTITEAQARRYPSFALEPHASPPRLLAVHYVHETAAFSEMRTALWLLGVRLSSGDRLAELRTPPWRTDLPGRAPLPPDRAIPASALVFLTSPFRWPHLGMSLSRTPGETDTVLSYVDCVYDQALRAQDMRRGERAVAFGEKLYRMVPGPQSAVAWCEGLRIAGQQELLLAVARDLPVADRGSGEFGMVLALAARDRGDDEKAERFLERVVAADPNPAFRALVGRSPRAWPATLRDILRFPAP